VGFKLANDGHDTSARPILLTGGGKFDQDPASRFVGVLVAAVAEDHDAEFASFHSPAEREAEARFWTGVTNPSRLYCFTRSPRRRRGAHLLTGDPLRITEGGRYT
jgi:hypothetical protein